MVNRKVLDIAIPFTASIGSIPNCFREFGMCIVDVTGYSLSVPHLHRSPIASSVMVQLFLSTLHPLLALTLTPYHELYRLR
jgi:hypothetical protein